MNKVFFNITIDFINDIKLFCGIKNSRKDSDDVYEYVSLLVYKDGIAIPLAETKTIIEPSKNDNWTLYLSNEETAEIKLLGMKAQISRDSIGNVFASISSPDFNSSFRINGMKATDEVPF